MHCLIRRTEFGERLNTVLDSNVIEDGYLDVQASTLSMGYLRRLQITDCLATPADLYLLDEPTNHRRILGVSATSHPYAKFSTRADNRTQLHTGPQYCGRARTPRAATTNRPVSTAVSPTSGANTMNPRNPALLRVRIIDNPHSAMMLTHTACPADTGIICR
ncbi:ATP-binding cassette domain-containing protein [Corynebacterium hindlerae]|uniref:ATP-binding cassette domain-containing protein n=1 Tax=Corynebacterium hindlerae TaxID=699041 RepID=A0A7G5FHE0_9CORY|nr:ATP-binding cassette domain-containing protein [Corynebacterium hindlerae]